MKNKIKYNPFVSIICVTYNRRPFIPFLLQCIKNQDYPANRYEIIIVDDGTDKIKDLIIEAKMPQIKYFELNEKMKLGKKRNYSHTLIDKRSQFITYFDDDDYHHPSRVSHSVEMLQRNPKALCAGSSEIYVFFKHINQMYKFGPYHPNHATAGTFTFKVELLNNTRFDDDACLAEERYFLKDYTIPLVQLDALKTILVVSHEHNTFDKKRLLENANNLTNKSSKTIESFISRKNETNLINFYMHELHEHLFNYEPGEPKFKPDVLKQTNEIELERMSNNKNSIYMQVPGKDDVLLSNDEVVLLINSQREEILNLKNGLNAKIRKSERGKEDVMLSYDEVIKLISQKDIEIIELEKKCQILKKRILELEPMNKKDIKTK